MLSDLVYRLRALFRRSTVEADMNDELRFHFEQEVNKYEKAGLPREEALRRARLAFGGIEHAKEECREARGVWFVETAIQELRYGLRRLRHSPGFTAAVVGMLALGIGATTAIFSVVNGVLLKPLPYPQPEELVGVSLTAPGVKIKNFAVSSADYFIFREQNRIFRNIGLYTRGDSVNITGLGDPERVAALPVTDSVLPILGVKPLLGRLFTRADNRPGSPDTAILTYTFWRRKFGGKHSAIGTVIDVNGTPDTVIGVLPRGFRFLDETNLAILLPIQLNRAETYLGEFFYQGIARLKPGATLALTNAEVARMLPIVLRSFPPPPGASINLYERLRLASDVRLLKQQVVGDVGKMLWILMGSIGLVLVIACANIANFLLLRVQGRRQELAIRAALGASRSRIAAELLFESFILAMLGGLFGLVVAYGLLQVLVAIGPASLPRLHEISIDGTVVLFALAVSLVASLLCGSVPAFKYAGPGLGTGLREGGRSLSESRERHRSRDVLVIVQVALALVLLVGSGLMIRTFVALAEGNPGFVAPSQIQTFRADIPATEVKDIEGVLGVQRQILYKLQALPGVSSVSLSRSLPMDGTISINPIYTKDQDYSSGKVPTCRFEPVAPGFFKTLGIPLLTGRGFTWSDIDNKVPAVIVSEKLAREYWRDPASALGKQIRTSPKGIWREIVGVVGEVRQDGMGKPAPASVYWPILIAHFGANPNALGFRDVAFVIRSPLVGSESLMNEVRQAVWSVDPNLPLFNVHTLDYYYSKSMARTSFTLVMLAIAGAMGLLLGMVGLYGVIAYSVSQCKREIGIRLALGARAEEVQTMVLRAGFQLAAVGVGIGTVAALGTTRFLASLLYGVKATDAATFVAISLLLLAVALLASYIPARQATKVDPMVVLRYE